VGSGHERRERHVAPSTVTASDEIVKSPVPVPRPASSPTLTRAPGRSIS
jgi:hypothetical protein